MLGQGEDFAVAEMLPAIYEELRSLAHSYLHSARPDHTLQPTALVHEAYMRLESSSELSIENRQHFFAIAAKSMRYVLADHAKGRAALKRGGGCGRVTLSGLPDSHNESAFDAAELDEALTTLTEIHERQASIVELRFFAGLTIEEVAEVLGISIRTVTLDWNFARAWLRSRLLGDSA
jgi:RNA polymerase sigma-70 factor (ECF subfamily)